MHPKTSKFPKNSNYCNLLEANNFFRKRNKKFQFVFIFSEGFVKRFLFKVSDF